MSGRDFDTNFGTGYMSAFNMAVVYKEGNNLVIYKTNCIVPWYTNSTNESLYNSFLNGEKDKTYKLRNEETTVVLEPVVMVKGQTAETSSYYEILLAGSKSEI